MPLHELLLARRMRDPDEIDRPEHLLPAITGTAIAVTRASLGWVTK
jgi:hypothetical protein